VHEPTPTAEVDDSDREQEWIYTQIQLVALESPRLATVCSGVVAVLQQSLAAAESACDELRESERMHAAAAEANSMTVQDLRDELEAGAWAYTRSLPSST
jgi:hypothetical protein